MCCSKSCLDIQSVLWVDTDSIPSWCQQEILHWLLPSTHPPARCLHVFRDEKDEGGEVPLWGFWLRPLSCFWWLEDFCMFSISSQRLCDPGSCYPSKGVEQDQQDKGFDLVRCGVLFERCVMFFKKYVYLAPCT